MKRPFSFAYFADKFIMAVRFMNAVEKSSLKAV